MHKTQAFLIMAIIVFSGAVFQGRMKLHGATIHEEKSRSRMSYGSSLNSRSSVLNVSRKSVVLHVLQGDVVESGWRDPYYWLAARWAPVIYQDTDDTYYKGDYITNFNYDGDWIGNNNWENLDNYDIIWAYVYYAVIETETHYFIFYMFYHPRDWNDIPDAGLGEHENDMEGVMVVITKDGTREGTFLLMETRAHLDFYQYSNDPNIGVGSDDIDGGVIFNEGRPTVFVEAKGHGVYAWDGSDFPGGDGVVYRFYGNVTGYPEYGDDRNVTYSLVPIMRTLWPRRYDIGDGHMYDKPFTYVGARFSFTNAIPEAFDGDTNQPDAANPPWGMDDGDDGPVYKGDWFLDPAYTVATHLSIPYDFSLNYTYNPYLIESGPEFNPPYLEVYTPSNGDYLNSRTVQISWYVSDEYSLYNLTVSINGSIVYWTKQQGSNSITVTLPSDGIYYLNITAMDFWGNYKTIVRPFIIDTNPPTIEITSPENGSYHASSSITVSWRASDDRQFSRVEIYVDGSLEETSYSEEGSVTLFLSDGTHEIKAIAYDSAGNAASDTIIISVDTTPPSVSITGPENNSYLNSGDILLEWNADDNMGIDRFEILVDDTVVAVVDSSYRSYMLSISEGTHIIEVIAYDVVNNTNQDSITIHVDLSPPSITIYDPSNGSFVSKNIHVAWQASDNYGLSAFEIYLNDSLIAELPGDCREYNITVSEAGDYIICVIAYDIVNHTSSSSVLVSIDDSPPVIVFNHENFSVFTDSFVMISWNLSDNYGVDRRYVKVDNNNYVEVYHDYISLDLEDGEHVIRVRAYDVAGNIAERALVIYVDTQPPSVTLISPDNNSYHNISTINVTWKADDVCKIAYSIIIVDNVKEYVTNDTSIVIEFAEGYHEINITVLDVANRSDSIIVNIVVDLTPPTVWIGNPRDGDRYIDGVMLEWYSTDNLSGVDVVYIYIDGEYYSSSNKANGSEYVELAPGEHTITLVSADKAGNKASVGVTVYIVEIEILYPEDNDNISSMTIRVRWRTLYINTLVVYLNGTEIGIVDSSAGSIEVVLDVEGVWNITICDYKEREFHDVVLFRVDVTPPMLEADSDEIVTNGTHVRISWHATDNCSGVMIFEVRANDTLLYNGKEESIIINLDEGFWIINITAIDYAGNARFVLVRAILDLTPPSIIMYPEDRATLNDTLLNITWSVSDRLSGVESITIFLDNEPIISTNKSGWITTNITDGEHIVTIVCRDRAGNVARRSSRIYVDAPPKLIIHGVVNNSYVNKGNISISWELFNGEIVEQHVYVDGVEYEVKNNMLSIILDEGTHEIEIVVIDDEGETLSRTIVITVDQTLPTVNILAPLNNSIVNTTRINIKLSYGDNFGVDRVAISVNGRMINTTGNNVSVELIDGENIIRVFVFDRAGNMAICSLRVTVDTTPPYIKITEPVNNTRVKDKVKVSWIMHDNMGIAGIEVMVNDTYIIELESNTTSIEIVLNGSMNKITVKVWDLAGNVQSDSIVVFSEPIEKEEGPGKMLQEALASRNSTYGYLVILVIGAIAIILRRRTRKRKKIEEIPEKELSEISLDEELLELENELESLKDDEI